ncbi:hypothetical protein [Burkholderia puraquae]|uniref:hypothetical protein n=1 Tax=Burkholderia puraquae TaxID=1904757 RepID=UPI0010547A10|nr:hypothetical protein [Burkholderia puraquae]
MKLPIAVWLRVAKRESIISYRNFDARTITLFFDDGKDGDRARSVCVLERRAGQPGSWGHAASSPLDCQPQPSATSPMIAISDSAAARAQKKNFRL